MKTQQLYIPTCFLLFINLISIIGSYAQVSFIDKSNYLIQYNYTERGEYFKAIYIDSLEKDSFKNQTDYYTIKNNRRHYNGVEVAPNKYNVWVRNRKVFIKSCLFGNCFDSVLIYDFNLNANDTLKFISDKIQIIGFILESRDSFIFNQIRKVQKVFVDWEIKGIISGGDDLTFIEGIGCLETGISYLNFINPELKAVCSNNEILFFNLPSNFVKNCNLEEIGKQIVSFKEKNKTTYKIYPNPATDHIIIETEETGHYQLKLIDMTGKLIQQESFIGKRFEMNFKVEKGIYQILISNEKGLIKTHTLEVN
jgi:hypothetical protein